MAGEDARREARRWAEARRVAAFAARMEALAVPRGWTAELRPDVRELWLAKGNAALCVLMAQAGRSEVTACMACHRRMFGALQVWEVTPNCRMPWEVCEAMSLRLLGTLERGWCDGPDPPWRQEG
jgi:hypothetical protein